MSYVSSESDRSICHIASSHPGRTDLVDKTDLIPTESLVDYGARSSGLFNGYQVLSSCPGKLSFLPNQNRFLRTFGPRLTLSRRADTAETQPLLKIPGSRCRRGWLRWLTSAKFKSSGFYRQVFLLLSPF